MTKERLLSQALFIVLFLLAAACFSLLMRSESISLPSAFAQGGGGAGEIIALALNQNTVVIVDGKEKKMLLYNIQGAQGLLLKEVRPFGKTLEKTYWVAQNGVGITGKDEEKAIEKIEKPER